MLVDTLEALRSQALSATDGAGYFPALYARVTRRVLDEAGAGRFDDAERMASFVDGFAARYLDAHRDPVASPSCWRAAFDVAGDIRLLVVQQLLLGINAHVNFDLPQTVLALADRSGDVASIRPDFDAVNVVLRATYADVIGDLDRVTRWTGRLATMGGGHLFNFSLRAARDQAWRAAVLLDRSPPAERQTLIGVLDEMVSVVAFTVTRPTRPFCWFAHAARHLESDDPATVVRALLGPLA